MVDYASTRITRTKTKKKRKRMLEKENELTETKNDRLSPVVGTKKKRATCNPSGGETNWQVFDELSCWVVEEWMEDCDASAAATRNKRDPDCVSVASIAGGFRERPRLDVGVWKKRPRYKKPRLASVSPERQERILSPRHQPTEHLEHFDTGLNTDMFKTFKTSKSEPPKGKLKLVEKLISALHSKKTKPMHEKEEPKTEKSEKQQQRHVRFEKVPSPRRRLRRCKSKIVVKRANAAESVNQTTTIIHQDRNERSSYTSADNASPSDQDDQKLESWGSDTKSVLSSRVSEVNMGSIIVQPAPYSMDTISSPEVVPQMSSRHFSPSAPKAIPSWQSRTRSQSRASANLGPGTSASKISSTLTPSWRSLGTLPPNLTPKFPLTDKLDEIKSDFDINRQRRKIERDINVPSPVSRNAVPPIRNEIDQRIAPPVVKDLRARRTQRSRGSVAERYHRDERARLWSS
ncbi:uncharacterized protein RSE6_04612 [Rhynchosporium secalis]|uniref:Uncharacterized protein n=1 Tax=Rhynchosporium secalis TaxID=38038 RepID=A0A1E1M5R4_RHYSE|nr:uncharacterized protein RSE6_04612 [Rhynchosporium secalis]